MRPRLPPTWRCSAKSPGPRPPTEGELEIAFERAVTLFGSCSALPLLVAGIFANHHHATVPADHLALVTDLLDARLDLPRASFWIRLGMHETGLAVVDGLRLVRMRMRRGHLCR